VERVRERWIRAEEGRKRERDPSKYPHFWGEEEEEEITSFQPHQAD